MSEPEPGPPGSVPDLESSLTELFHAPSPEVHFVSLLERSLLDRARTGSRPSLRQRFSGFLASAKTGLALAAGALVLVMALIWGIRNLIPAVLPAQKQTPTPDNLLAAPQKSPAPGELPGGLFISGTFTGLENPDDPAIYRILSSRGEEASSGTQRGDGPWEAQIPNARSGSTFSVRAEASGYLANPERYELIVQEGQVVIRDGARAGQPASALHFAFSRPVEASQSYTNPTIGFSFSYPGDWTVEEAPRSVFLRNGPYRLGIAFRRPEESISIQPSGMPSGEMLETAPLMFLGQEISRSELLQDDRVKRVLYDGAREIQFKDIAFVLVLEARQPDYAAVDIPDEVQAVADQVLASFNMPGLVPLPDILSNEGLGRLAYIGPESPPSPGGDGDIWVRPLPDGEPIRLTSDGNNMSPLWSPSGRWLAYRHGEGQVILIRADGSAAHSLKLGPVTACAWSPAADRLAFRLGGEREGELWVVNADGTGLVNLAPRQLPNDGSEQAGSVGNFLWHPLGGLILYEWRAGAPDEPATAYSLRQVNAFTGEEMQEIESGGLPPVSQVLLAGWLAEGKLLLAWASDFDSASLLADGAPLWQLPYEGAGQAGAITETLSYRDYLSPDPTNSGRLAAISGVGREAWAGKRLYLFDYETARGQSLTGAGQAAAFPAFSPDGRRLAYVGMPDQGAGREGEALRQAMLERRLWLIEFPAGVPESASPARQLTGDPAYRDERPEWSRDGQYLVFPRLDGAGNASLWLAPVEGGDLIPVVNSLGHGAELNAYYGYIDWDIYLDWWQPPAAAPDEYPPQPDLPQTTAPPLAALAPPTASFSEPLAGYTFDYPEGWHLNSVPGSTQVSSSDPATWAVKGSLPPGETQLVFITDAALKGASFEDLRAATFDSIDLAGEQVLREENWRMPGGVPAVRLLIGGPDGEYAQLVTVLDGAPLQVKGYGDLALFDAIIATLRGGN